MLHQLWENCAIKGLSTLSAIEKALKLLPQQHESMVSQVNNCKQG